MREKNGPTSQHTARKKKKTELEDLHGHQGRETHLFLLSVNREADLISYIAIGLEKRRNLFYNCFGFDIYFSNELQIFLTFQSHLKIYTIRI